jgi:hypothetical protein
MGSLQEDPERVRAPEPAQSDRKIALKIVALYHFSYAWRRMMACCLERFTHAVMFAPWPHWKCDPGKTSHAILNLVHKSPPATPPRVDLIPSPQGDFEEYWKCFLCRRHHDHTVRGHWQSAWGNSRVNALIWVAEMWCRSANDRRCLVVVVDIRDRDQDKMTALRTALMPG